MEKVVVVRLRNWEQHPKAARVAEVLLQRIGEGRPVFFVLRAGRRGAKTTLAAYIAEKAFKKKKKVLYGAPTDMQCDKFWFEIGRAYAAAIGEKDKKATKILKCNDSKRELSYPKSEISIRCKTLWNADTARGGDADLVILDEFQLMNESVLDDVIMPMLLTTNGSILIIYTPPSLLTTGVSKATDPRNASKIFKKALQDTTGVWEHESYPSWENPYVSKDTLQVIAENMSLDSYRREIMAEDDDTEKSWMVYASDFNESVCKIKRFAIPDSWPCTSGHDFGKANPAALFATQVKGPLPEDAPKYLRYNDIILFAEYKPGGGTLVPHIDNWKKIVGQREIKSYGGNHTTEDETRMAYTLAGWKILEPLLQDKGAQIDKVKTLLGYNKIYIFSDLLMTLSEMAGFMFKINPDGTPSNIIKDESNFHLMAAWRYLCPAFNTEDNPTRQLTTVTWYKRQ